MTNTTATVATALPEALHHAAGLESFAETLPAYGFNPQPLKDAAAELRRLHALTAAPAPTDAALAHLDALLDDAAAHIYPSDLARCQTSECTVTVASVRVGCPAERSIPLYTREQVAEALDAARAQQEVRQ